MTMPSMGLPGMGGMDDDLALAQRNAQRMMQQGKSPAEINVYLDSVGVPKRQPVTIEQPDPGKKWEDQAKSFLGSAFQSLTLGFGDEAVGNLVGLVTNKTTSQAIDDYRAGLAQVQAAAPGYATAGGIAGALAPAAMTGGVGAGAGILGRMGAGAAVGAGTAAATAIGSGTGTLGQRAEGVGVPAVVGGALGGLAPLASSAVGTVLKPIASKVNIVSKMPGASNARDQADALLHRAFERDGLKLEDLVDQARNAANQGKPLTISEIGGENVRGLMAASAGVPGKAKQTLLTGMEDRQVGQGGRLLDQAQGNMKLGLQNVYALRDKMLAQRARDAKPLYDAAYAKSVTVDGALQESLDNPEFHRAYTLGKSIAAIEGVEIPPLYVMAEDGSKVWAPELPVQALDYMKRGLDKRITAGINSKAGVDRTAAHHLRGRLEDILQNVDQQVPEYGIARSFFKGESEAMKAADLGREFNRMPPDAVAQAYGKMSTVEKEMARTGYLENLERMMGRNQADAPNLAKSVFGSPDAIRRVKVLFGDGADDMIDAIRTEKSISKSFAKLGGSRTAPLGAEMDDMAGGAGQALAGFVRMNPGQMVTGVARGIANRSKTGWTEEVSDELAQRFSAGLADPHDLYGMLLGLTKPQKPAGIGPLPSLLGSALGRIN